MCPAPSRPLRLVAAAGAAAALLAGCGGDDGAGGGVPSVVVTTSILGDVVRAVAGDGLAVTVVMDAGADPHEFRPSARDAEALQRADVVVANGGGLEMGLLDNLAAAADAGATVVEVLDHVDPLLLAGDDGHDDGHDEEGHGHGDRDPHFWHDPRRMARAVEVLGATLDEVDPGGGATDRARAYATRLQEADREIEARLAVIPPARRTMVTDHDAFGYLAARYDLEVIGVIVPGGGTSGEASSADLARLVEALRPRDVPAIFTENTGQPRLARTVAEEMGGDVEVVGLFSDALGPPDSGAATYLELIRTNAGRVADALA